MAGPKESEGGAIISGNKINKGLAMISNRWSLDHKSEPMKLNGGFIPRGESCPFISECETKKAGKCFHYGETHPSPYACKLIDIRGNFRGSK